ncbi:hypothetical protein E9993_05480 [Labilibacter sediminis]|nr:hypothetical protein E9993_05480 [Labilibacter sediminis]
MRIIGNINSQEGNSFEAKVRNTLFAINKKTSDKAVVKLCFYLNSSKAENFSDEYNTISDIIKDIYKKDIPAYTIISQAPHNEDNFAIEYQLWSNKNDLKYKSILKHPYVTISHNNGFEIISGGIQFSEDSLLFSTQRCFDFAEQILMAEELNFGHIYRQWNYIPQIGGTSNYDGNNKPCEQVFNEIKEFFYEAPLFVSGMPLETNSECKFGNVTIDFYAFSNHLDVTKTIRNIDNLACGKYIETENKEIWLANAASTKQDIANSSDDVEQQTLSTLQALLEHIESSNLERNKITISDQTPLKEHFKSVKIYVKNKTDINKVHKLVTESIRNADIQIVNTEFSIENLLVDIEGLIITNS